MRHYLLLVNNKADAAAKAALDKTTISNTKVPYTDSKPAIKSYIKQRWQTHWDQQQNNKLHSIKPTLGYQPLIPFSRQDSVVLRRCRIGHSHITHSYILKGEDPPICIPCQSPLTVEHILLECVDTAETRDTFYTATNMHHLFNSVSNHHILAFLTEVKLYNKI